jgi:hypothetical protein
MQPQSTTLFAIFLGLGSGLPIGALVVLGFRARRSRKRLKAVIAITKSLYGEIAIATDRGREESLRAQVNSALAPYGLKDLTYSDFSILPLLVIEAVDRPSIPNAWIEFSLVGLGVLFQAAAAIVSVV